MRKYGFTTIFILNSISLLITLKLFYNMGIYVDEYGTSMDVVLGSDFWLNMDWLRLLLVVVITFISGVGLKLELVE